MDKALQGAGVNTEPGTTKAFAPHPHPPAELSVVTWNVDGLDERHLEGRAEEVCSIVGDIHPLPEFVLLQEVVGATAPIFMRRLRAYGYKCTDEGKHERHPYFTIGFFLASRVEVTRVEREAFHNSEMGRDLLKMFCNLKGAGGASPIPLLVMTSHLESEKRHGDARCEQFRSVLEQLRDSHVFAVVNPPPTTTTHATHTHSLYPRPTPFALFPPITFKFAGDTNLRMREVKNTMANKFPRVKDAWAEAGAEGATKFTFDTTRNRSSCPVYLARLPLSPGLYPPPQQQQIFILRPLSWIRHEGAVRSNFLQRRSWLCALFFGGHPKNGTTPFNIPIGPLWRTQSYRHIHSRCEGASAGGGERLHQCYAQTKEGR